MSDGEHPVLRQIKNAARQEGRAEAAATITQLRADLAAANERAEKAEAVAATAYGASLDWEQILQDDALWAAQDDIAKSRVACMEAEADAAALRAQVERMRAKIAALRDTIRTNIVTKDGPHTVEMPDGSVHSGPLADYMHDLLPMIADVLDAALAPAMPEDE
jgi:hypothetical protein